MRVTRAQIVSRGLRHCCPNCGESTLFKEGTWFELNRTCPSCQLKLERDEGSFLGAMSLNYGVTILGFLLPVLILYLYQRISGTTAAVLAGLGAVLFPMAFYRSSRSWWLMNYYLVLPHHLPVNRGKDSGRDEDDNT